MQDWQSILRTALVLLAWLLPVALLAWCMTLALIGPLRRIEQSMLFLEVLETGLRRGLDFERSVISASRMEEKALGVRFYLLSALLEEQTPLKEAIQRSRVLPRFGQEMLLAALEGGGDILRMIGAIRASLARCLQASQRNLQGPTLMFFLLLPSMMGIAGGINAAIIPKWEVMFLEFELDAAQVETLVHDMRFACRALIIGSACLCAFSFFSVATPYWARDGQGWVSRLRDRVSFLLPWRRMRMCEDFSRSLALLLDAGLPEAKAVRLAGRCAGNGSFERLAFGAEKLLGEGATLADAVKRVDSTPEFGWRLRQGGWGVGAFQAALRGWVETLCIRASVKEEWVAQISSIFLLFANGILVALLVSSVFALFSAVITEAASW